jgi:hypothetical protein
VTIDVPNNAPVSPDDSFDMEPDTSLTVNAPGVLGNDYDPDGDSKTEVFEPGNGPFNGWEGGSTPHATAKAVPINCISRAKKPFLS